MPLSYYQINLKFVIVAMDEILLLKILDSMSLRINCPITSRQPMYSIAGKTKKCLNFVSKKIFDIYRNYCFNKRLFFVYFFYFSSLKLFFFVFLVFFLSFCSLLILFTADFRVYSFLSCSL